MKTSYFASDLHFGHPNILKYCPDTRPFASDELMKALIDRRGWDAYKGDIKAELRQTMDVHNQFIVDRINERVGKNDTLWVLGDVSFRGIEDLGYVKKINCRNKKLVLGNHDLCSMADYISVGFSEIFGMVRHKEFVLTHAPVHPCQLSERYKGNIHGHLHTYDVDDPRYINVNIDRTNITPLSLAEIRERINDENN